MAAEDEEAGGAAVVATEQLNVLMVWKDLGERDYAGYLAGSHSAAGLGCSHIESTELRLVY